MQELQPFTVIGHYAESHTGFAHHVLATCGLHAFAVATRCSDNPADMEFVVAIAGHHTEAAAGPSHVTYPAESSATVDGETVLSQPEVFGTPAEGYTDDDETPDVELPFTAIGKDDDHKGVTMLVWAKDASAAIEMANEINLGYVDNGQADPCHFFAAIPGHDTDVTVE